MNQLIREIIKPILEADSKINKVVGIYGGRFQPFGPHHLKTFKWLEKQTDDAYIVTSNIMKPPRHPMNFNDKVKHIVKMGISKSKIIQERNVYQPINTLKQYDEETTAVIFIVGEKDAGRLSSGKYFQDYQSNKNNMVGYKEHGYIMTAPHTSISIGGMEVSGTSMRELLGSHDIDDKGRAKLFKKMFGYFNKSVFNMMVDKFKKLFEISEANVSKSLAKKLKIKEILKKYLPEGTLPTIEFKDNLNEHANYDWIEDNITISEQLLENQNELIKTVLHEINHAQDRRKYGAEKYEQLYTLAGQKAVDQGGDFHDDNIFEIKAEKFAHDEFKKLQEQDDVMIFKPTKIKKVMKPHWDNDKGKELLQDLEIDLNIGDTVLMGKFKNKKVVVKSIDWNEKGDLLINGRPALKFRILKKENALTRDWWNDLITEELVTKDILKPRKKELLLMGGAYGHMAHPFDDKDLTFKDLKQIITDGLGGTLNREDNVTEKLDGQNLMISWIDSDLRIARNKGHLKNFGENSLDVNGIKSKFEGRGNISDAFGFAVDDLKKAIKSLSDKQQDKIFANGEHWMNLEVMWPASANVIDYDVAQIIFHGALQYDKDANVIGDVADSGRMLAGMIEQRNQNIQNKYSIGKPVGLEIPKDQDFSKSKAQYIKRLNKLKNEFRLKDRDTLSLYHQKWWEAFIRKQNKKISAKVLKGLIQRWAFFNKKYSIAKMKKDIKDVKFLKWALKFDKQDHAQQVKENMKPFETLFFEVGAQILKNVQGFIAANPDKAVQKMRKELTTAINAVKGGGDITKMNKVAAQIEKLQALGGPDSIVPSEGIVFKYDGKTYKFTGAFAPVNQILGMLKFGR
jgi:hypothetical protein